MPSDQQDRTRGPNQEVKGSATKVAVKPLIRDDVKSGGNSRPLVELDR